MPGCISASLSDGRQKAVRSIGNQELVIGQSQADSLNLMLAENVSGVNQIGLFPLLPSTPRLAAKS
jgi:hypothetical protein